MSVQESDAPRANGPSGPRAGFWRRFAAALVDGVLVSVLAGITFAVDITLGYVVSLLVSLAYYGYFEGSSSGQTVGKKLLGIRVIDFRSGGAIGFGRALVRWIARNLSAIPCFLGYFWMLWDRERQTWHDKLANCVVVPEAQYPVDSWLG